MPEYMLCRICLAEDGTTDRMSPLFNEEDPQCRELVRKIEEVGSIKLMPLQDIPSMLCFGCADRLAISYKFRELCRESEGAFATNVVKAEMKCEPVDETTHMGGSHIDYIYDGPNDFMDASEEQGEEEDEEEDGQEEEVPPGMRVQLGAMLEERLDEGIGEVDQPYAMDTAGDDVEDNELIVPHGSDSDYTPGVRCRKTKLRKTRHSKRSRGRPRSSTRRQDGEIVPVQLTAEISQDDTATNIMCEICGNIYSKRAALNIHMRRHMAEKPFECEICGKSFAGPSELNRHIRVHTGEKPFTCKYCARSFADRSSNIRHERTHTNERPFTCATCGKSFSYSNVLKNHMLTHTGEKPFLCRPCNKTFSRKHQLEQHVGTMTHQQTVRAHQRNEALSQAEIY